MALKLYNTLTRKKEEFNPIEDKLVKIYTCGPTVYDFAHIGNFRAYVCSDILKRYLKYKGYGVSHVMNLTDVDDKTIKGANKEKIPLHEYTQRYENAFFEDLGILNIDKADIFPKATEHIKEMVDIIQNLMDKEIAYKGDDASVYYDLSKFEKYGELSHTVIDGLKAGARVKQDSYDKEQARDFALWKSYDEQDGEVFWETKIGKGRPGWHIECSAMSMKYLGEHFDIHAGGIDLVFPHHENEIAQSEASTGKKFVNYWIHNEHLLVDGHKMSKSLGNFYTLRDLLNKRHNPMAIRYLLLSANYRIQLNFTEEALKASENAVARLNDFMVKLGELKHDSCYSFIEQKMAEVKSGFEEAMDDDLNISAALAHVFDFIKHINTLIMEKQIGKKNSEEIINLMREFNKVLGVLKEREEELSPELRKLIDERESARKTGNFKKADEIRLMLKDKGIVLEDTREGNRWKKVKR